MKLRFWGATEEVTGSMTFIQLKEGLALVDCGLTQGPPDVQRMNLMELPVSPETIKAVFITHAHLDHSGFLPRLIKKGFSGKIYCTPPTAKLARIILLDSAKLNEDDFYDEKDVQQTLHRIQTIEWKETFDSLGARVTYYPAGHILGASSIKFEEDGKSVVFSGDLGRTDDPILPALPPCPEADIVVMESTYGGRVRIGDIRKELQTFLVKISRGSRVGIIASFAVARAQTLLTLIHEFYENHPEYKVRVVMDSPMMKEANKVYQQYSKLTNIPDAVFDALNEIDAIEHQKEWESLKRKDGPLIILSSSGMLTGGRISRHLANWQDDERAVLYLPGYQGEGTPGRSFIEGNRTLKGPQGELIQWMGEVMTSEAFSSHADQNDLIEWVSPNKKASHIFLLHGEQNAKSALKTKLQDTLGVEVTIPKHGDSWKFPS